MMARIVERGRDLGAQRAEVVRGDVAARLASELADVAVTIEGDDVVVAGRGLHWRVVREPALRWIGSMFR